MRLFPYAVLFAAAIPAICRAQDQAPRLTSKVEPECTRAAQEARINGSVVLGVTITDKGIPTDIRVVRGLEHGLTERAVEALEQWRFEPGIKDGRPATVEATVEVNFRCP